MPINDIISLSLVQSMDGDVIENQFFYVVEADDDGGNNEDKLAIQFEVDVLPAWQACVTDDLSMDCIGTQVVGPTAKTAFRDRFINVLGSAVGDALPLVATALLQKFDPAVTGRGKKGHTYISGVSESGVDKGRIDSPLEGNLILLGAALVAKLLTPANGIYRAVWAVAGVPLITQTVDWVRTVALPRISHQSSRKTPIRKVS